MPRQTICCFHGNKQSIFVFVFFVGLRHGKDMPVMKFYVAYHEWLFLATREESLVKTVAKSAHLLSNTRTRNKPYIIPYTIKAIMNFNIETLSPSTKVNINCICIQLNNCRIHNLIFTITPTYGHENIHMIDRLMKKRNNSYLARIYTTWVAVFLYRNIARYVQIPPTRFRYFIYVQNK